MFGQYFGDGSYLVTNICKYGPFFVVVLCGILDYIFFYFLMPNFTKQPCLLRISFQHFFDYALFLFFTVFCYWVCVWPLYKVANASDFVFLEVARSIVN
jgi:hypothetical protein